MRGDMTGQTDRLTDWQQASPEFNLLQPNFNFLLQVPKYVNMTKFSNDQENLYTVVCWPNTIDSTLHHYLLRRPFFHYAHRSLAVFTYTLRATTQFHSLCLSPNPSHLWFRWTFPMVYSEATLEANGHTAQRPPSHLSTARQMFPSVLKRVNWHSQCQTCGCTEYSCWVPFLVSRFAFLKHTIPPVWR
jgi:hypothetical protein